MTTVTYPARTGLGASNYLGEYTYANLPSASAFTNKQALATDLGANGTMVRSNGTRWSVANGTGMLKSLAAPVAGITNTESIVAQTLIPAGAWQTNDTIRVWLTTTKSGTTDSGNLTVRIGTAGTTADTAVTGLSAFALMAASGTSGGSIVDIKLISATSAQKVGANSINGHSYQGSSVSTAAALATTITDASANALWLSVGLASSGATNTLGAASCQIQIVTP